MQELLTMSIAHDYDTYCAVLWGRVGLANCLRVQLCRLENLRLSSDPCSLASSIARDSRFYHLAIHPLFMNLLIRPLLTLPMLLSVFPIR